METPQKSEVSTSEEQNKYFLDCKFMLANGVLVTLKQKALLHNEVHWALFIIAKFGRLIWNSEVSMWKSLKLLKNLKITANVHHRTVLGN